MSNIDPQFDPSGQQQDPNQQTQQENPNIRQLREQADKVPGLETKLAQYERNESLRTAGLDGLSDVQREALFAVHKGESTPDALQASAKALGYNVAEAQTQQTQQAQQAQTQQSTISAEEQQLHAQGSQFQAGASAAGNASPSDQYKTAKTPEQLTAMIRANGGYLSEDIE